MKKQLSTHLVIRFSVRQGSALLMVLLVTTALVLAVTTVWRSTAFAHDLALARQRYYEQRALTESALDYGALWVATNVKELSKKGLQLPAEMKIYADSWHVHAHRQYRAQIAVTRAQQQVALAVQLLHADTVVCKGSCVVTWQEDVPKDAVQKNDMQQGSHMPGGVTLPYEAKKVPHSFVTKSFVVT